MSYLTSNPTHFNLKIAGANLTIFHPSFFDEKSDSWKVLSDTNPLPVTLSERTVLTKALDDLYKESTDTLTATKQLNTLISQMKLLATGPKGDKGDIGLRGPQGVKGDKGDKGDIGPKGEQGEFGTSDLATQTEAEAGTSNTKLMTPLRTKQVIDKIDKLEIATQTEAETGTNNTKVMTPLRTKQAIEKRAVYVVSQGKTSTGDYVNYSDGLRIETGIENVQANITSSSGSFFISTIINFYGGTDYVGDIVRIYQIAASSVDVVFLVKAQSINQRTYRISSTLARNDATIGIAYNITGRWK